MSSVIAFLSACIGQSYEALYIELFPDLNIYTIQARSRLCVETVPNDLNVCFRRIVEFEFESTQ